MTDNPMADNPIRVLVTDDQHLIREGIASLLAIQPGIDVIATAPDGPTAIDHATTLRPDVILMDVRMPGMDGVEATTHIRATAPTCRVIMLTTFDDHTHVLAALRAGAVGYLLKDLPPADLAAAIRVAHAGLTPLHPTATAHLTAPPTPEPHTTTLTPREADVLRHIAHGHTNREIARHLHVSEGTVKNHISRILSRLGLRDRTQAAIYARDHHLI